MAKRTAVREPPARIGSAAWSGPAVLAILGAVVALLVIVIRSAWVCDDAFITFRTIDNLVHAHGPRWNVAERVQTFTHPLWMLLLAAVHLVTREAYYTVLAVSILISGVTAWWLATRVAASPAGALLAILALALSKAFVDYSTSGLENPLTFLLLVLFVSFCLPAPQAGTDPQRQPPDHDRDRLPLALALIAGLVATNRMDTLLIVLPALIVALRPLAWRVRFRALAIGFAPFLIWEAFALFYYGVPFPNSAYAKLATGIPRLDLVRQGLHYVVNSIGIDPVTLIVVVAAALFAARRRRRNVGEIALLAGVGLYIAYVIWIGGDFMSGRFFAAPLAVAAAVLSRWRPTASPVLASLPFAAVAIVGLIAPRSPVYSGADYAVRHRDHASDAARITDERAFYYNETGLLRARRGAPMPDHPSARDGRQARAGGPAVVVRGGVGMFGYYAGPQVHIVEPWAVTDPLLARLPIPAGAFWRIGHFRRDIPVGYEETLRAGVNRIADPGIARRYDDIEVVTRGPLITRRRILAIWRLNTGG